MWQPQRRRMMSIRTNSRHSLKDCTVTLSQENSSFMMRIAPFQNPDAKQKCLPSQLYSNSSSQHACKPTFSWTDVTRVRLRHSPKSWLSSYFLCMRTRWSVWTNTMLIRSLYLWVSLRVLQEWHVRSYHCTQRLWLSYWDSSSHTLKYRLMWLMRRRIPWWLWRGRDLRLVCDYNNN